MKKGFENNPKRCAKCRGQVCDLFSSTGDCPYGVDCKFLHPASGDNSRLLILRIRLISPHAEERSIHADSLKQDAVIKETTVCSVMIWLKSE